VIQYKVPVKYTTPARRPNVNARMKVVPRSAASSGASAIHASAGCPNFGKLSARRSPDAVASA
jgi:hypothetical protein